MKELVLNSLNALNMMEQELSNLVLSSLEQELNSSSEMERSNLVF
jgi:hypothetical protein